MVIFLSSCEFVFSLDYSGSCGSDVFKMEEIQFYTSNKGYSKIAYKGSDYSTAAKSLEPPSRIKNHDLEAESTGDSAVYLPKLATVKIFLFFCFCISFFS